MKVNSFFLFLIILLYGFQRNPSEMKGSMFITNYDTTSKPPAFKDGGKTIDSLKKYYNCESIEFDNWDMENTADSTLTVCLVNSTKVPTEDVNENFHVFMGIASCIKSALKYPEKYKAYYIIFIEKGSLFGSTYKTHKAGITIPASII